MKTKDVAKDYGLDLAAFDRWVRESSGVRFKAGMMGGLTLEDPSQVDQAVNAFKQHSAEALARVAAKKQERDRLAQHKQQAMANMLVTSGFNFDGYRITKYSGYISGDDVVQIDRGSQGIFSSATNVGDSLMASLSTIRRRALTELKEAAYELGCNAVIGVDFDYLTLDPETAHSGGGTLYLPYVFGVTANGNAVIIEKC